MKTALFAGSFDPITNGHIEIIKNAASIFDKLIVAVAFNVDKKSLLSVEERVSLIEKTTCDIKNIQVTSYQGLTVEYAKKCGADFLVRGIRNASDMEYELQIKEINEKLNPNLKTLFLTSKAEFNCISSSAVKEILYHGGDISKFTPNAVCEYLNSKRGI